MSMIHCKYCQHLIDTDFNAEHEDECEFNPKNNTYTIYRFYRNILKEREVVKKLVSLKEAKEHCESADSKGPGWFDGYQMD